MLIGVGNAHIGVGLVHEGVELLHRLPDACKRNGGGAQRSVISIAADG